MLGKTHLLVGAVAGLAFCPPELAPAAVLLGAAGGLLPDLDHPQSRVSRAIPLIRLLTFWIPHRTLTHSVWAVLLLLLPALVHPVLLYLWAGYTLHILCDMATFNGVPVLYPVLKVHLGLPKFMRIRTGEWREGVFTVAVALAGIALLWGRIAPTWLILIDNRLPLPF